MRKLVIYLSSYKKESFLAPFFKLLEVVFDLIVPLVVARIIDVGIVNNDRHLHFTAISYPAPDGSDRTCLQLYGTILRRKSQRRLCYKSKTGSVRPYSDAFLYRAGYTWYRHADHKDHR